MGLVTIWQRLLLHVEHTGAMHAHHAQQQQRTPKQQQPI